MRIAAIDIGTNTVLLLIADIDPNGSIQPVHNELRFPRLGRDVDKMRMIRPPAFDRIAWVLNEYKNLSIQFKSDLITACATSALRDAANRDEFLAYLRSTAGVEVEILSGEEEARLAYDGALSGFDSTSRPAAVIDIGGGSTEVSYPVKDRIPSIGNSLSYLSFQLGAVRLTERYLNHNPPTSEELSKARRIVHEGWESIQDLSGGDYSLIGVAGTVTTLACLDQGLTEFDANLVGGYTLPREHVERWFRRLSEMRSAEIEALTEAAQGRADILVAGSLILLEFMIRFRFEEVIASDRGLRYGLAIREWKKRNTLR
jgi:exopolyphosphatase/guanosine-5'-triphosphate,3'-diphosphate pyrophosphatase